MSANQQTVPKGKSRMRVLILTAVLVIWGVAALVYVYYKFSHRSGSLVTEPFPGNPPTTETPVLNPIRQSTLKPAADSYAKLNLAVTNEEKNAAVTALIVALEDNPEVTTDAMRKSIVSVLPIASHPANLLMFFTTHHDVAAVEMLIDAFPAIPDASTRKAVAQSSYVIDKLKTGTIVAEKANENPKYLEFLEIIKAMGYRNDK